MFKHEVDVSMRERFESEDGRRLLIDTLKAQHLVEHNDALATRIAERGELVEFKPGEALIRQDSADNDVFLIIDGEAGVFVNKRHVATRKNSDSVGEMALVDGSARRSATVSAMKPLLAVKIREPTFQRIAEEFPRIWRSIAMVVAERLWQRVQFHRPPNEKPVVFIGSSVEGLPVAKQIQLGLMHSPLVPQLWINGVFGPGGTTIETLMKQADASDIALFVFGPDDRIATRTEEYAVPRDNVVFELGLFMGHLDRSRSFIVMQHGADLKIPTDLLGLTPITYVLKKGVDLAVSISPVCTQVETLVGDLGTR